MNVTIHSAHSLAENAVEQSFSTLESWPPREVTDGVTDFKDLQVLRDFFLHEMAPQMLLKIDYSVCHI